jgi:hypothetical protein
VPICGSTKRWRAGKTHCHPHSHCACAQSRREIDGPDARGEVGVVEGLDASQVLAQARHERLGEGSHPVAPPLPVPDHDLAHGEIEILHPEAQAFEQPKPGAIEQFRHEGVRALEPPQTKRFRGRKEPTPRTGCSVPPATVSSPPVVE